MRNETRKKFEEYTARIAHLSGVSDAAKSFNVEPSVQQTLETRIQESSEFLSRINIVGVRELKGEKLGLGISGPIAGRTNVENKEREPRDLVTLDQKGYECHFTEYDTYLRYATLDAWAKFPDFKARVRDAIVRQEGLDRIMIGFNGTSAAKQTDRNTNPLLQDVNIGWLQQYRNNASNRVLKEVGSSGKILIGKDETYKNLDSLVYDAVNEMIDPWYRESTELVAICGRKLLSDKYFPLVNQNNKPSEQQPLDLIFSQKRMGGLQSVRAPFVPDGAILITSLSNLSIYWQEGSRRRHLQENPKRNRIENYESSNDAYVIEDYGFGCLVENIEFVESAGATEEGSE